MKTRPPLADWSHVASLLQTRYAALKHGFYFDHWDFKFIWSLIFGAWDLLAHIQYLVSSIQYLVYMYSIVLGGLGVMS